MNFSRIVCGFLLEARLHVVDLGPRHAEGDHVAVDPQRLRLLDRGAERPGHGIEHRAPRDDDVVEVQRHFVGRCRRRRQRSAPARRLPAAAGFDLGLGLARGAGFGSRLRRTRRRAPRLAWPAARAGRRAAAFGGSAARRRLAVPATVRESLLEPVDAVGEDLQRTAGVAPAEPDERDLEHEPRIGRVGAAHVDHRLAERLEAADDERVAEHLTDCAAAARARPPARRRAPGRVPRQAGTRRAASAAGPRRRAGRRGPTPAAPRAPVEPAGHVLRGDRVEDREAGVERRTAEHRLDPGRGERAGGVGKGLVEERFGVPGRPTGGAGDRRERIGLELDAFAFEQRREEAGDLLDREQGELEVLGARPDGRQHLAPGWSSRARTRRDRAAPRASSSSAFDAALLSMCTSSIRYTLTFEVAPMPRLTRSTRSRIVSTPLFDAASISTRSLKVPAAMATQFSQVPSGSPSAPRSRQLSALARMRAVVVLPVPRGPEKRYAWPTRPSRTALRSAVVTCSWPTSSSNRCGRYFR